MCLGLLIGWLMWALNQNDPAARNSAEHPPSSSAPPDYGLGRLIIESVGLDVPLRTMSVVDGAIDPPGIDDAYVLDNHGALPRDGAGGTVFVAMHAVNRGTAPGNLVTDPASGTFAVQTGDQITVDGAAYQVDDTELRPKADTAADSGLWDPSIAGRLVVVTCLPNTAGGPATQNAVITAHRLG
jgi:hypothetical protein